MNEEELKVIELINNNDGFTIPLEVANILNNELDTREKINEVFNLLYGMVDKSILRVRNCEGLAFEFNR